MCGVTGVVLTGLSLMALLIGLNSAIPNQESSFQATASAIVATNDAVATWIQETQAAATLQPNITATPLP